MGATARAVDIALRYAEERYGVGTESIDLHNKELNFCIHCDHCLKKKGCVHKDFMTEVYPKLENADGWIMGSPVYHGHMSGQLKTFLDRLRASLARDPNIFNNKIGAGIASGGDRNGGQEPTLQSMIDFYIINSMIPVGGGVFGANLGSALWSRDKGAEGTEADAEGLRSIQKVIDRMVQAVKLVRR
jgi:multimeric flavodoxin WrbA